MISEDRRFNLAEKNMLISRERVVTNGTSRKELRVNQQQCLKYFDIKRANVHCPKRDI